MCGITGIFDTKAKRSIDKNVLSRMNDSQYHRGPDQDGLHIEEGVGLGHRRLSIIDISSGKQPLYNEDNSVVVVYNGEIYNFPELAEELQKAGHTFRTRCDTEVIVHAWEQWGEACVERFRGMFAFAIWDKNKETFFMARDRLGIKPLYYSILPDGKLIFGSELKSLMVYPQLGRDIDPYSVEDYFAYGYVPEPKTIFKNTYKLSPGHSLTVKRGAPIPQQKEYWDVPFNLHPVMDESEVSEELLRHLKEAVDIRLVAEVPLGAFLSGGVDSSAVVAMMAGLNESAVNTCSISFGDPKFNEASYAQQIADQYKTDHRVEQVDPNDFDLVGKLGGLYDEPYADSSAMPTYRLCELARKNVTVALSGDGGDENFAGYRRYRWHNYEERIRSALPLGLRRPVFGTLGNLYPKADWAPKIFRAKTTFEAMARDTCQGYLHSVSLFSDKQRESLFNKSFKNELQGYNAVEVLRHHANRAPTDHPLSLVQYMDMKTYLVGDILTKVDRASMAHSLEVRVPLLDHKFVEWISGLPPHMKLKGTEGKYIFKKSLESHLSQDILYRKKMGFGVPLASWFRGPLKEKVTSAILGEKLASTGMFEEKYLNQLVSQHQSGVRDYSAPIWTLLMFESFLDRLNT
ncbi:MAG: amidotransferase 1, exosortase A system-associated [Gammaproteobacteria bacterium]|nr:amidotransferase 1, exosortase A system-associated [Gammaproteobacteria bacterium]